MGLKNEHRKDKGDGCRQHPNKREQCADRKCTRLRVLGTTLQPQGNEPGRRDTTKNHGRLGGIRQTLGHLQKQHCHLPEETGVQLLCAASYDIKKNYGAETWTLTKQAHNKLAAAQTKMERSMLNITYKDRKTNIWVRERTKVIDIINTVRKMKWSWAGHINRLKDDRWTSGVTTWRPYDKKRRQGRPAKRWRDDLDKYWSDTIWQRKAQDMVILRRHAEAFAQPRDTTAA